MLFPNQLKNRNKSCPEQGGTGMRAMPEKGGTGASLAPESGGTGISGIAHLLMLFCLALPFTGLNAAPEIWTMTGETVGSVQISIDSEQQIHMGFMMVTEGQGVGHFTAVGPLENGFGRLQLYRIGSSGAKAVLVPYGTVELFLDACAADGEMQLKAEADGSGGKSVESLVFSLSSPSVPCSAKSEADGSGKP